MSIPANRKFKNHKKTLIIIAILFALIYSVLAINAGTIFNSPDESANYFFSQLFATQSKLDYKLNIDSDVLHPRSMTVVNQKIVPQSFLGLPLIYGTLGKIFGKSAILFFTPIIAVISVLFFYEIIKNIFDEKIAFLSSLLVLIHPAFWYYATHSMYHNALFLGLLIVGLHLLIKNCCAENGGRESARIATRIDAKYLNIILASFFLGLALIVRSAEAPWVVLILVVLWFFNRQKFNWKQLIIGIAMLAFVVLPILFFNNKLYGHPLSSGYSQISEITAGLNSSEQNIGLKNIWRNFWNYGVYLFWWLSLPMFFGLAGLLKNFKKINKKQQQYLVAFLIGAIYLILYYGRLLFNDHPDPSQITIGTSYARYWLPIYVFSMPFVAFGVAKRSFASARGAKLRFATPKKILVLILFSILLIYNFLFIFKLTDESIANNILSDYAQIKEKVLNLTEPNSIIIAGYYDKLFFPERLVIENIDEERDKRLREIGKLLDKNYPVYYYSWYSDGDVAHLNETVLGEYELEMVDGVEVGDGERLFSVKIPNYK